MLVKVIDRILYKLDDLVRPYVHKILVVIEPLLIDEDYYARIEVRGPCHSQDCGMSAILKQQKWMHRTLITSAQRPGYSFLAS